MSHAQAATGAPRMVWRTGRWSGVWCRSLLVAGAAGLATLLVFGQSVFAGLGELLPSYDLPPYVCAVNVYDRSGRLKADCSGTLISDKQVLTAGHCIRPQATYSYRVWCHGQGTRSSPSPAAGIAVISVERHPGYSKTGIAEPGGKGILTDLALLNLAESPGLRPAALVADTKKLASLIEQSEICGLFGFGDTRSEEKQFGYLRGTVVPAASLELRGRAIISHLMRATGSGIMTLGDSGGSLSCKDSEGSWVHVGVAAGSKIYPYDEYYASVADDDPFLSGKLQRSADGKSSGCDPARWCLAAETFAETYGRYRVLATSWDKRSVTYLQRLRGDLDSFESEIQTAAPDESLEKTLQNLEKKFQRLRVIAVTQGLGRVFLVEPYSMLTFDASSPDLMRLDEPEELVAFLESLQETRGIKSTAELAPSPLFIPVRIDGETVTGTLIVYRGSSQIFLCEGIVLCRSGVFQNVIIEAGSLVANADLLNTQPSYLRIDLSAH